GLLGGAAVASRPLLAFAQDSSKRPLIVTSVGGSRAGTNRYFSGFSQGMRELGYVEGLDYTFEVRYADGQYDHIPAQNPPAVIAPREAGLGPSGTAINPAGTLALVANYREGTVSIFNFR